MCKFFKIRNLGSPLNIRDLFENLLDQLSDLHQIKIATWNLERPKIPKYGHAEKNDKILEMLIRVDADILVLTETNSVIHPGPAYISHVSSNPLPPGELFDGTIYHKCENRTTIWSKFPLVKRIETSNDFTNVCADIQSPYGVIRVYGCIIGIRGQKKPWFMNDLENVVIDGKDLSKEGDYILAGDFNLSFSDQYYPHRIGKEKLNAFFEACDLEIMTSSIPENIDHIAISKSFKSQFEKPNIIDSMPIRDKSIRDHKWVCITVSN